MKQNHVLTRLCSMALIGEAKGQKYTSISCRANKLFVNSISSIIQAPVLTATYRRGLPTGPVRHCCRYLQIGTLTWNKGIKRKIVFIFQIVGILQNPSYCKHGSEAIRIIMTDYPDCLSLKQHCRSSLLHKQRMFVSFSNLAKKLDPLTPETKEDYFLSWAYVLAKTPKTVLNNEALNVSLSFYFSNISILLSL